MSEAVMVALVAGLALVITAVLTPVVRGAALGAGLVRQAQTDRWHRRPTPAQLHQDVVLLRNVDFVAGTRRVRARFFVELRAHHCTIIAGHQQSIRTTWRSAQ